METFRHEMDQKEKNHQSYLETLNNEMSKKEELALDIAFNYRNSGNSFLVTKNGANNNNFGLQADDDDDDVSVDLDEDDEQALENRRSRSQMVSKDY